ncbi:MAG: tetratricopeptide repeat protein [Prevotella sp.]|nr:tetratricopeptide repeat protein [Prevotella sp.]
MRQNRILSALLLLLGVALQAAAYTDHRNRKVDSIEALLSSGRQLSDENKMDAYKSLMWGYLNTDGERSALYARKAIALSYRHEWQNSRADALRILGMIAYGGTDYDKALEYYNWALALTDSMRATGHYDEATIDDNYSALYGSIGNLYNMQDQAHMAIAYYQKALPYFEKYGWMESATILYYNVGELYDSMGNDREAEHNYLKAVETGRQSGDSLLMALPTKGLGKIYIGRGEFDKAEQYAQAGYRYYHNHIEEENGDYITTLNNLARIRLKGHDNPAAAETYAREALSLINDGTGSDVRANVYNLYCEIAMARGRWAEARDWAQRALDTDTIETIDDLGSYALLAQAAVELGERQRVKEYIAHIYNGMEQYASGQYQSGLSQMEVLYETEKKRVEAAQKQAENDQLRREKRWYLWGGILTALVLLLLAFTFLLLWLGIRQKRKSSLMQARLAGEVGERVRLSRDLHDRLGGILTALRQQLAAPAEDGHPVSSQSLALTDEAIREMRNVAHHLLPDSLRRYGLRIALRDFCLTMPRVTFSFLGEERHIAHEEAIYCIVYELVNNAVKSSGAQHIRVQLLAEEDYTAINVSDDGIGIVSSDADAGSSGSGLRNIRERVEAIGGTFDMVSRPGEGIEANINIKHTH